MKAMVLFIVRETPIAIPYFKRTLYQKIHDRFGRSSEKSSFMNSDEQNHFVRFVKSGFKVEE